MKYFPQGEEGWWREVLQATEDSKHFPLDVGVTTFCCGQQLAGKLHWTIEICPGHKLAQRAESKSVSSKQRIEGCQQQALHAHDAYKEVDPDSRLGKFCQDSLLNH